MTFLGMSMKEILSVADIKLTLPKINQSSIKDTIHEIV